MSEFYRVEEQLRSEAECKCPNCVMWTVLYDDGEPIDIGTAWQGDDGKEAADDICDLMNMAFDAGRENPDGKLIDERDRAEEALSQAYYLVIGRSPEWSNLFGHAEALEEIEEACEVLRKAARAGLEVIEPDEPPEADGECFRGNEAAAFQAEEQARIQRELK